MAGVLRASCPTPFSTVMASYICSNTSVSPENTPLSHLLAEGPGGYVWVWLGECTVVWLHKLSPVALFSIMNLIPILCGTWSFKACAAGALLAQLALISVVFCRWVLCLQLTVSHLSSKISEIYSLSLWVKTS
jgi:hypothetical protein